MSSLVESLQRQSLIAQRNSLTNDILRDSSSMRHGNSSAEISKAASEVQLKAVNAELNSLKKAKKANNKAHAVDFYA